MMRLSLALHRIDWYWRYACIGLLFFSGFTSGAEDPDYPMPLRIVDDTGSWFSWFLLIFLVIVWHYAAPVKEQK